jgi:hypothetical protein
MVNNFGLFSGCHQTIHHFELKEKLYYRLNTKWDVWRILINIAFPHRQLPKALHCLRYETRTKADIRTGKEIITAENELSFNTGISYSSGHNI